MRYQLPDGMDSISVCGQEFQPDEDGQIDVPSEAGLEVHMTLQSPHHFGLKVVEDEPAVAAQDAAQPAGKTLTARDEKKRLRDLLSAKGIREDGRATLAYLRRRVAEVFGAEAEVADPTAGGEATGKEGQAEDAKAPEQPQQPPVSQPPEDPASPPVTQQ